MVGNTHGRSTIVAWVAADLGAMHWKLPVMLQSRHNVRCHARKNKKIIVTVMKYGAQLIRLDVWSLYVHICQCEEGL